VAWVLAVWPSMPGFVAETAVGERSVGRGWVRVFQLNYFVGYISASLIFWILNKIWPPEGLGEMVLMDDDNLVVEGVLVCDGVGSGSECKEEGEKRIEGVVSAAVSV